jgi:hypothetical protein
MIDQCETAHFALLVVQEAQLILLGRGDGRSSQQRKIVQSEQEHISIEVVSDTEQNEIYFALNVISPVLASSYEQVKIDLQNPARRSWAGTAHEVREILAQLLRLMASDEEVKAQSWFRQDPQSRGPTMAQRAKFILQKKRRGKTTIEMAEREVQVVDEKVSELVRSAYNRASDAAHNYETRSEVVLILRYFEALMYDLIEVPSIVS